MSAFGGSSQNPVYEYTAFYEPNYDCLGSRHAQAKPCFGLRQVVVLVLARKQMAIDIGGHRQGGMPESRLHRLQRQLQAAIDAPIDAPRGEEMAQVMQAGCISARDCRHARP